MKSWRYIESFGMDHLKLIELPDPSPGYGQAVVEVHACSLNYRDLVVARGAYGRAVRAPLTPLSDGAGQVIAVGPGVTRVKPGDRVCGCFMQTWLEGGPDDDKSKSALGGAIDGMAAERVCLNAEGLAPIPDFLSYEEAATLPCAGVTAWNALFVSGSLKAGDSVVVLGSGGVSLFALQFAKMAGARVIATSGSDQKIERLKHMGADATVNYKSDPDWSKAVRAFTSGVGADHVVEVGGAGTLPQSIRAVRTGGYIALIGVLAGQGEVDPRPLFVRQIRLQGIYVGSREMFEAMNRAIAAGRLRPAIDRVFAFDELPEAMGYMESGAHFGKICVKM